MNNLFKGNVEKQFFLWVDPENYMVFNNLYFTGHLLSNPLLPENSNNLLFVPNPQYNGGITPYQNNVIKKIRTEYWLEFYRPQDYPSRLQAIFVCETQEDAEQYKKLHSEHTEGRILVGPKSVDNYNYSIHDSGWFDYLCLDASIDQETIKYCADSYWLGNNVKDCSLTLYERPWSQPPTREVLFYGTLKTSHMDREKISILFKKAYKDNPEKYPTMNFE